MLIKTPNATTVEIKYLACDIEPRYLDDSQINGEDDIDYDDQYVHKLDSRMPLMEKVAKIKTNPWGNNSYSIEYHWLIIIDLDEGRILDWKKDTNANIRYKVCDQGRYSFLDGDLEKLIGSDDTMYVPSLLDFNNDSFGDYLHFNINEDGYITEWNLISDAERIKKTEELWVEIDARNSTD